MSENKFTPGTWSVGYGKEINGPRVGWVCFLDGVDDFIAIPITKGSSAIAWVCSSSDCETLDDLRKDAKLIAAAPELLEALEALLDSLGALANKSELYGWMVEEDQEKIWKAIAKAKGEL